jgi:cytochrome P450
MDELNGMTYLDYVTREVLRLHTPVPFTDRTAKADVVVPLSQPFIDRRGVKRHEFRQVNSRKCGPHCILMNQRLRKGDMVIIPILAVHVLKSLWGEDAKEFK